MHQEANFLKFYALECSWSYQDYEEDVKREHFQSWTLHKEKKPTLNKIPQRKHFSLQQLTKYQEHMHQERKMKAFEAFKKRNF